MTVVAAACTAISITISGSSLAPLVNDGDHLEAFPIECAGPTNIGDLLVFRRQYKNEPIIKIIAGQPGDELSFTDDGTVIVNGKPVLRPTNEKWVLSAQQRTTMGFFAGTLKGWLVVGNPNSYDSSLFGVIGKSSLLAVVRIHQPSASARSYD